MYIFDWIIEAGKWLVSLGIVFGLAGFFIYCILFDPMMLALGVLGAIILLLFGALFVISKTLKEALFKNYVPKS